MATVTFLVHPKRADAFELATETAEWLTERGDVARILRFSGPDRVAEAGTEVDLGAVDLAGTDVAVSLGGDGTFLRVVRLAATADVPVLGVNFGRLGYLPDLGPGQVREALKKVLEGKAAIEVALRARGRRSPTVRSAMTSRRCWPSTKSSSRRSTSATPSAWPRRSTGSRR